MGDQRIHERPIGVPWRRMHDEPGRFINHDQLFVLVDDDEGDGLSLRASFLSLGDEYGESLTEPDLARRVCDRRRTRPYVTLLDQALDTRARQRRDSPGQDGVNPSARILGSRRDLVFDLACHRRYPCLRRQAQRLDRIHARAQGLGHRHGDPHPGRDGACRLCDREARGNAGAPALGRSRACGIIAADSGKSLWSGGDSAAERRAAAALWSRLNWLAAASASWSSTLPPALSPERLI